MQDEHDVFIKVDVRRDHDEGQPPHWDVSCFSNDVAKAIAATTAPELYEENVRLKYALMSILRLDASNDLPDAWDIANDALISPDAIAKATGEK